MFINMACVYKQGWCLQTGMRGGGGGGGGGLEVLDLCLETCHPRPPPVSSHRAATPSTASSVAFLSFCPQPPIPLTIPTHQAPHSKNQACAGTISTNHTTLSILSGGTRRVLDFRIQHNFVRRCCENAGMYDVFCVWCV